MCEEGEEEIPSPSKNNIIDSTTKQPLHKIEEVESQSKVSTAYTNDGPG